MVRQLFVLAVEEQDVLRLSQMAAGLAAGRPSGPNAPHRRFHERFSLLLAAQMETGWLRRYDPLVLAELLTGIFEWVSTAALLRGEAELTHFEATLQRFLAHALLPERE
jgi:hypothetical protein